MQDDALFALESVTLRPARLRDVSLVIPRGITAVLGASGAGKTSLLNLLAGFEKPGSGKVLGDLRTAWVPQGDGLWPDCTAHRHLTECGASSGEADRLLAAFDIAHCAKSRPVKLSHGERNRLAVARALAMGTRTLVMDEPLAHVDSARVGKYWRAIREHIEGTGASFVFATHAPEIALAEAGYAVCLREGAVLFSGKIETLYDQPASEEIADFLGPANWLTPDDARQWLRETWREARCLRPERLLVETAEDGAHVVTGSRFLGSHAETEVRAENGVARTFIHRPGGPPAAGTRVRLRALLHAILCFAAMAFFSAGCKRDDGAPVLPVKSWRTWMLPPEGATQPTARSMAAGPRDELAVLDTAGRVLIYSAEGALLRQWKMLDVQFGKPEGIVWLKDDRIVVCDTHYHRVVWFDQAGKVLHTVGSVKGTEPGQFIFPVGITKDAAENLYVCEYGGHDRIQVFTRDGELLREFGSAGTGPGQFQRPSGMAWRDGKLFVADAANNRVHLFKDSGEFIGILGEGADGKSALALNLPYDLTFAPDGTLYIIEYGAGRLTRVSTDGRLLGRYGSTGTGEGQFATPWGLCVDSKSRIFVADTKNRRIVALQLQP